jgi:hypothetical protein
MRRTQLLILAIAVAAAAAILAPLLAARAREPKRGPERADRGAPNGWPGLGPRLGEKPAGTIIALYGDLALADRFSIPADAAFGPRGGSLELDEAPSGARVAPAADPLGPLYAFEAKAGAARQKVAFFGTSAAIPDPASLGEAIRAFEVAEPGALCVAYVSAADRGGGAARGRADVGRKLRRAGAEIVVWYGVDRVGALSEYRRQWIFYGLGGAASDGSLALRLLVEADQSGAPRADLRAYPIFGGRASTAREYGAMYWDLILASWVPEEHMLKRRFGLGFDDVGRHFSFGKVAIDGRP